ncbi:MAG: hypothetical protein WCK65_09040 [Rhodospirillaceae bacterium]
MTQVLDSVESELVKALKVAVPYVLACAHRSERMGLVEEAALAWTVYRRALWSLRASEAGGGAAASALAHSGGVNSGGVNSGGVNYED